MLVGLPLWGWEDSATKIPMSDQYDAHISVSTPQGAS